MLLRLLEQEKQIAASVRARVARRREENKKKPTKNDDKEKNVSSIFLSTVKIETIISLSLSLVCAQKIRTSKSFVDNVNYQVVCFISNEHTRQISLEVEQRKTAVKH